MNKQEALKRIEAQKETIIELTGWAVFRYIETLIEQLDEPEKVKIPQFVADWIKTEKRITYNIRGALRYAPEGEISDWLELNNVNIFAEAWVNGYEVEKEPKYIVKLKNGQPLVKAPLGGKFYFNQNITAGNYKATRKELEEANFGWVFDCEGLEVEEVAE